MRRDLPKPSTHQSSFPGPILNFRQLPGQSAHSGGVHNLSHGSRVSAPLYAARIERLFLDRPSQNVLDELYTDALQGLTTLRVLTHKEAPLTKAFIEGLSGSTRDPCLLPRLENLELGGEPAEVLADALVEMAKARRRMGRPLKRLFFDAGPLGLSARAFGWHAGVERRLEEVVDCVEVRRMDLMESFYAF